MTVEPEMGDLQAEATIGDLPDPTPEIPRSRRRHLVKARRAVWNLVDQVLSAFTNTAMAILVARNVDAQAFGSFAVALLIFSLTVGVVRAMVAWPLAIRHSQVTGEERRITTRAALGTSVALAVPVSAALFVAGGLLHDQLGRTLAAMGLVLPMLIVQDSCRYAFFTWGRPELATLNDFIWTVGQFSASALLILTGHVTPAWLVLAWGFGASLAATVGCVQLRVRPAVRRAKAWLIEHKEMTGYYLSEYLVSQGAFQGGVLIIAGSMGVGNLGSLRAAQTLVGPLGIISTASSTFGIPEVSRLPRLPRRTLALAGGASLAMFLTSVAYTCFLLLIPDSLGSALFGDTWAGAETVLLAVAAASVIGGLRLGPVIFVYGRGLAKRSFRLVVVLAVASLTFMAAGAWLDGVVGMAWGMALAQLCVAPLWFVLLRNVARAAVPPGGADSHPSPGT